MNDEPVNVKWQDKMARHGPAVRLQAELRSARYTPSNVRPDEAMQVLTQYFYLGTDREGCMAPASAARQWQVCCSHNGDPPPDPSPTIASL